ncbi:hypothetical protein PROFUN_12759 [Planoprotostelium fungivorum]|uniref:Uncharacterized protein n=1 Tax=Planoprotostelium fungivorum TaxID=1890364 RepID=A0A2P6N5J3_9EUKA|nr:hypothetical protein PROFUN_12759 [Planoprotostelium fungivorum]
MIWAIGKSNSPRFGKLCSDGVQNIIPDANINDKEERIVIQLPIDLNIKNSYGQACNANPTVHFGCPWFYKLTGKPKENGGK